MTTTETPATSSPEPEQPKRRTAELQPLLASWLRSRQEFLDTVGGALHRGTHRSTWHGLRLPLYMARLALMSPRGLWRVARQVWHVMSDGEARPLRIAAVVDADPDTYMRLRKARNERIRQRTIIAATLLGAAVLLAGLAVGLDAVGVISLPPAWTLWVLGFFVVQVLGWVGRPVGKPLVKSAVVLAGNPGPLRAPVVMEALCSLRISGMTKPEDIGLLFDVARVGPGYQVDLELPRGVSAGAVMEKRSELSAALRRELGCVWPSVGKRHEGHLVLFIADEPMNTAKQAKWPLLKAGAVNIFVPAPAFTDQRGRWVDLVLAYTSGVIGAVPRMGKTFALRLLLLIAGLDPRSKVYSFDLKGTGDLSPTALYAHVYCVGDEDDEIAEQLAHMRELRQEMRRRAKVVRGLSHEECPDNKVTDELANRRGLGLEPIVVGVDECFPAGTLVGGRAIESLRSGDVVPSWDERSATPVMGIVRDVFKNRPISLVRVNWAEGGALVCTPGHPIMTDSGWKPAGTLSSTDRVLTYGQEGTTNHGTVLDLQDAVHSPDIQATVLEEYRSGGVLARMLGALVPRKNRHNQRRRALVDLTAHGGEQPDAQPCDAGEGVRHLAGDGSQASGPARERYGSDRTATTAGRSLGLADGGRSTDWAGTSTRWVAHPLQARHWESGADGGGGGRRRLALRAGAPRVRSTQGCVAVWRGVDRVEVLEPGSDGRYGGLCPDGHVYNFEVEGTHTYRIADGVVAHNCQVWFEHEDVEVRKAFIAICTDLVKRGPALGIILYLATQKPDAKSIPTAIADNAAIRLCFKVGGQVSNDQVLGTSSYKQGLRATLFAFEDKGIAYFKGEGADAQIVRTVVGLDAPTSEKVAMRARQARLANNRLTGMAAGETMAAEADQARLVEDVRHVFEGAGAMHLGDIAEGLALLRQGIYGHLDNSALASMLRAAGVRVETVYVSGKARDEASAKGVKVEWLDVSTTEVIGDAEEAAAAENAD